MRDAAGQGARVVRKAFGQELDVLRRGCTTHEESLLGEDGLDSVSLSSRTEEESSSGRSERAPESSASFPICVPPTSSIFELHQHHAPSANPVTT